MADQSAALAAAEASLERLRAELAAMDEGPIEMLRRGELAPPPPDVLETTPDLHWRIRLLIVRMEFEARGGDWEEWLDEMTFREDSSSEDY